MRGSSPGVPLSWQPAWPGDTGLDLSYSPFDYVFQSEVGHFDWYLRTHIIGELADISFSLRKLPSSDWMNLRRDLNFGLLALLRLLWTMGSFEIELNVFLIMLWLGMAPTDSCV